jgi:hypothetical protein
MRIRRSSTWAGGILAGLGSLTLAAGLALAEEAKSEGAASPAPATNSQAAPSTPAATPDATAKPVPIPSDPAAAAAVAADPLARIREEGKRLDAKADQKATAAFDAVVADVEKSVPVDGDQKIAERLAGEFGVTADALLAEKNELKVSWGQLMLARSLIANSTVELTTRQLVDLRNEGMSWPQIAKGMGLRLGEVLSAAKAEAKVAKGAAKADGKVAVVHGAGSKSGLSARVSSAKPAKAAAAKAEAAKASPNEAAPNAEAQSTPAGASEKAPGK